MHTNAKLMICYFILGFQPLSAQSGCSDLHELLHMLELLNVMDFGKVVENELSFLFTTRTIMVQLVLTGYLLFSSIYSEDYKKAETDTT